MGNAVMSESAERGGQFAKTASIACVCVSGAVLAFVSFDLPAQNEPKKPAALAKVGAIHQLASLHPPLVRTTLPGPQNSPTPARSQHGEPSPQFSGRASQAEGIKSVSIRGAYFDTADDVAEHPTAKPLPWGVHLTAGWSREKALDQYERIRKRHSDALSGKEPRVTRVTNHSMGTAERYVVHIAQPGRAEAESLCSRITEGGGACAVYKNWRQ